MTVHDGRHGTGSRTGTGAGADAGRTAGSESAGMNVQQATIQSGISHSLIQTGRWDILH